MRASRLMRHPVTWIQRGSDGWYALAAALANPILMAAFARPVGGKPVGAAEELAAKRLFHSRASVALTQASSVELRSAMNGLKEVLRKTYDNVSFRSNGS